MRIAVISRDSSNYISLEQGFKDFIEELHKLEVSSTFARV